jgi:hypothetical protein
MKVTGKRLLIVVWLVIGLLIVLRITSWRRDNLLSKTETKALPQPEHGSAVPAAIGQTSATPGLSPPASYQTLNERLRSDFEAPINFYGKVVDQYGDPVPSAVVRLGVNNKVSGGRPAQYTRTTDTAGTFSIVGIGGLTLTVEVSKPGYRVNPPVYGKTTSSGLFEYGLSSHGPHQSSKDAPTIFTLYKIGAVEPLVKNGEKNYRMARDGSPLPISLDLQGGHQVILRCWNQELLRTTPQREYDWSFEISVPAGGLIPRKDAFGFEAPADGYVPSDTVTMSTSLGNQWRSFVERSYFLRFDDGTFARAKLDMHAAGDHFVVWESFLNPTSGSRNLESGQ